MGEDMMGFCVSDDFFSEVGVFRNVLDMVDGIGF